MDTKYNGWKNRSTWLVVLHLDNTNLEINTRAKEIAIVSNTTKQFKNYIKPLLLEIKELWKEKEFDILQADFREIWEHYAPSTKY